MLQAMYKNDRFGLAAEKDSKLLIKIYFSIK